MFQKGGLLECQRTSTTSLLCCQMQNRAITFEGICFIVNEADVRKANALLLLPHRALTDSMTKTLQALNASNSPPASPAGTAIPGARVPAYQLPPAQARLISVITHRPWHANFWRECKPHLNAAC